MKVDHEHNYKSCVKYFALHVAICRHGAVRNSEGFVGFEVVTAVVIKSTVFWDITPYSP
jgi:hypothetical protein